MDRAGTHEELMMRCIQLARLRDQLTEALIGRGSIESKDLFYMASPLTYTTIDKNHSTFPLVCAQKMILLIRVHNP